MEDRQAEDERKRVRDERRAARRLRRLGVSTGAVLARRLTSRHRPPSAHSTAHDAGASATSITRLTQRRSQAEPEPEPIEMRPRGASAGAREETVSSTSDPSTRPNAIDRFIDRYRPAVLQKWAVRLREAHNQETLARADATPRQWTFSSMLWPTAASEGAGRPGQPPPSPSHAPSRRGSTRPTPPRSPAESDTDEEWVEPAPPEREQTQQHFGDVPSYPPPRTSRWPTRGPREVDVF